MPSSNETDDSRLRTDDNLRTERQRSDEELEARSTALAENSDDVIARARERARKVLELARSREDDQLAAAGATAQLRDSVQEERTVADATLAAERATADADRLDERERRRIALLQLLAHERSATDETLTEERRRADQSVRARRTCSASSRMTSATC